MYLEAHIKVTKMYRKGDMSRKKCKERERERGGGDWDDRDTDSERERNSNTVKKIAWTVAWDTSSM